MVEITRRQTCTGKNVMDMRGEGHCCWPELDAMMEKVWRIRRLLDSRKEIIVGKKSTNKSFLSWGRHVGFVFGVERQKSQ